MMNFSFRSTFLVVMLGAMMQPCFSATKIRVCERLMTCEDGTNRLTREESEKLSELLRVIKPGANESHVSSIYLLKEGSKTPPFHALGTPQNALTFKAIWYVTEKHSSTFDPHIDVYFMDDRAFSFNWWINIQRHVDVLFIEDK